MKAVQLSTTDESHFNEYLDKIRKEIHAAAENWFHIAYFVYEMKYFEYYKVKYDNIVDCCQAEFGFKKSTTYNFINIVEQFGGSKCMTINMKPHKYNSYVGYSPFYPVGSDEYNQIVDSINSSGKSLVVVSPDGTVCVYDENGQITDEDCELAYNIWVSDNNIMTKPLDYYTPTEGLLFLTFIVSLFGFFGSIFRRRKVM